MTKILHLSAGSMVLFIILQLMGASAFAGDSPTNKTTQTAPQFQLPRTGISNDELAIVVNDNDPLSREIAAYYQAARAIPDSNVLHVRIPADKVALSRQQTLALISDIRKQTPTHIQAYALAWTKPYRADCMSVTSAVALGFNEKYCTDHCRATAASPYFDANTTYPHAQHDLRPTMMLAGKSLDDVKRLIDRGVRADFSYPRGTAYLLNTSDRARSVRAPQFELVQRTLVGVLPIDVVNADSIGGRDDVLFYFTGLVSVPGLETLHFMPGALADHLTSWGGDLLGTQQMSSLRWLEAGATASYGTVQEPCNFPQKFPVPGVAISRYAAGATAVEAYWKSVPWPGEGLFIGEPLARPFAASVKPLQDREYELTAFSLSETVWQIEIAASTAAPFQPLRSLPLHRGKNVLRFSLPADGAAIVNVQPR